MELVFPALHAFNIIDASSNAKPILLMDFIQTFWAFLRKWRLAKSSLIGLGIKLYGAEAAAVKRRLP